MHDIIVFGATGFTGGLVAKYLAQTVKPGQLSWALAGRDPRKLHAVRRNLEHINPAWSELPLYQGLSHDPQSLHDLAARTQVMLTTVGPYTGHGEALVAACVAEGCDYVDLTGEPVFWRTVIERHHDEAAQKGVRIVPCCGFDSIPHDFGVQYTLEQLSGSGPTEIDGYVTVRGKMSGGTWASLLQAMAQFRSPDQTSSPSPNKRPTSRAQRPHIHFSSDVDRWVVPMPTIDPLVVRRTVMLVGSPELRYRHYLTTASLSQLATLLGGIGAVFALSQTPARHLLKRLYPSGSGPSQQDRNHGSFSVTFIGRQGAQTVTTEVTGGDPGYGHTAKMIAQAARCLADDRNHLPERYGVLTPAAAMGTALFDRLRTTGMEFVTRRDDRPAA